MSDPKFTKDHEWVRLEGGIATIGITDYAQEQLGDLVFVELPEAGKTLAKGDTAVVVESVKAASDVYAPVGGMIIEVNTAVTDEPESVNKDAFAAWLFKMKPSNVAELDGLLDAAAYTASVDA